MCREGKNNYDVIKWYLICCFSWMIYHTIEDNLMMSGIEKWPIHRCRKDCCSIWLPLLGAALLMQLHKCQVVEINSPSSVSLCKKKYSSTRKMAATDATATAETVITGGDKNFTVGDWTVRIKKHPILNTAESDELGLSAICLLTTFTADGWLSTRSPCLRWLLEITVLRY